MTENYDSHGEKTGEINVEITCLTLGPFQSNCYLIRDRDHKAGVIIDPGDEPDRIISSCSNLDFHPDGILATHGHIDHIGAVKELKDEFDVPFYIHPEDRNWVEGLAEQASTFGLPAPGTPEVDHDLKEGMDLEFGSLSFDVLHTPGHTPGGVSFRMEHVCFVGDCVFAGSIGRTDFPGGDQATLLASIREKILTLSEDTTLYPGHGPKTTVQKEATSNPFL